MTAADSVLSASLLGAACPDKRWVGRSFSSAAEGYDRLASLQRLVGDRLLACLMNESVSYDRIVDVGAGTGYPTGRLMKRFPTAQVIALDIAEGMLRVAREHWGQFSLAWMVCADAESLPLADQSVDLVFSNLAIQWCSDLRAVFREFRRILKPGGQVLFSTFGSNTLIELQRAWAVADQYSHVLSFGDVASVQRDVKDAGFSTFELELECQHISYADVYHLMRELKGLGAHNVTTGRPRHLVGKGTFKTMMAAYQHQTKLGGIQASFEIIQGRLRV